MSKKITQTNDEIKEQVMSKIGDGSLHMQSKLHFVILGATSVVAIVLMVILATYFISVASLYVRLQIAQGPAYGIQRNLDSLLQAFPWQAIVFGCLSIVTAIYLIIKSGKMYKIRLAYLVPIVIAVTFVIGFILSYSSLPNFENGNQNGSGSSVKGYHYNR